MLTEEWIFKKTLSVSKKLLSYASSKIDYNVGENIHMLPGNMNLNIRSGIVGYNNKIPVSDGNFSLGKNDKVNTFELAKEAIISKEGKISHKDIKVVVQPSLMNTQKNSTQKQTIFHKEEKVALILSMAGSFAI